MEEKLMRKRDTLRDVVIGLGDGLTVSFALAAGLSVVISDSQIILTTGLIVTLVQSIAMGLSGWFSGKGEQEYYYNEIQKIDHPESRGSIELQQRHAFYNSMGFPEEMQDPAFSEINDNNRQWVEFLRRFDLAPAPGLAASSRSAWNVGLSYAAGGLIPLLSFFFVQQSSHAIIYSICGTLAGLFLLGYYKSKITGRSPFSMAVSVMATGAVAAICTYFVAFLFR